jgi:hypothetical protein
MKLLVYNYIFHKNFVYPVASWKPLFHPTMTPGLGSLLGFRDGEWHLPWATRGRCDQGTRVWPFIIWPISIGVVVLQLPIICSKLVYHWLAMKVCSSNVCLLWVGSAAIRWWKMIWYDFLGAVRCGRYGVIRLLRLSWIPLLESSVGIDMFSWWFSMVFHGFHAYFSFVGRDGRATKHMRPSISMKRTIHCLNPLHLIVHQAIQ